MKVDFAKQKWPCPLADEISSVWIIFVLTRWSCWWHSVGYRRRRPAVLSWHIAVQLGEPWELWKIDHSRHDIRFMEKSRIILFSTGADLLGVGFKGFCRYIFWPWLESQTHCKWRCCNIFYLQKFQLHWSFWEKKWKTQSDVFRTRVA